MSEVIIRETEIATGTSEETLTATEAQILGAQFETVVRAGLDPTYTLGTEPTQAEEQIPFGEFTAGDELADGKRAALASATGNSGNNAEESC